MSGRSLQLVRRLIGKEISTHAFIGFNECRLEGHVDMLYLRIGFGYRGTH